MRQRHIEMYDGTVFCGANYKYDGVHQQDWHTDNGLRGERAGYTDHDSLAAVRSADCTACLRAIAALGAVATLRAQELDS